MEFLKIWEILFRRRWLFLFIFFAFLAMVVIATRIIPPTYSGTARLLVGDTEVLSSLMAGLGLQGVVPGSNNDDTYDTEIALVTLKPLLDDLITGLDLKDRRGDTIRAEKLIKFSPVNYFWPQPYVEAEQYEESAVLEIKAYAKDSEQAVKMANQLANAYIADAVSRIQNEFQVALDYVDQRIDQVRGEYLDALGKIKTFRVDSGVIDLNQVTENLIDRFNSLRTSYEDNEDVLASLEKELQQDRELIADQPKFRKDMEEYSQSPQYNSLKSKLNDLLVEISVQKLELRDIHPALQQLQKELETVQKLSKEESQQVLSSERKSVDPIHQTLSESIIENMIKKEVTLTKRRILEKYMDKYRQELLHLPALSARNSQLNLVLTVKTEAYQDMLQYKTRVDLARAVTLSNIKIVEPASPKEKPQFPIAKLNYLIGIFLGFFWAFFGTLFVEYVDPTPRTPDDLRQCLGLPLLAEIPFTKALGRDAILQPQSLVNDGDRYIRTLRNNLLLATRQNPPRHILVMSMGSAEGKSMVAAHLALSMTRLGKTVLLVDFNCDAPIQHTWFDLGPGTGLTDLLLGRVTFEQAAHSTKIAGLDLMPQTAVESDAGELLFNSRISELYAQATRRYDVVITDTGALAMDNGARNLTPHADAVVFVTLAGKTLLSGLRNLVPQMQSDAPAFVGLVLNHINRLTRLRKG